MGSILTREQLLEAKIKTAEVEAFGGTVLVREMPADKMEAWRQRGLVDSETGRVATSRVDMVDMALAVIVDEDGEQLLNEEDAELLGKKSAGDVLKCFNKSLDITDFGSSNPTETGATESGSSSG